VAAALTLGGLLVWPAYLFVKKLVAAGLRYREASDPPLTQDLPPPYSIRPIDHPYLLLTGATTE
jgi:hypothetical protein